MGDLIYDKSGKASRTAYDTRWWAQAGPSLQRLEQRIDELAHDFARLDEIVNRLAWDERRRNTMKSLVAPRQRERHTHG